MMLRSRLLHALLIVVSLVMLVGGVRLTSSGAAAYQAEAFMTHWALHAQTQVRARQSLTAPQRGAWEVADAAARRAVAVYPVANGEYLDRLGRVAVWQQFPQPAGNDQAQASRRAAVQAYRAAAQARPTWPDTQARLAFAKLQLGEIDADFRRALAQAGRLGPWRPEVVQELASVGLMAWPALSAVERARTVQQVQRSAALARRGFQASGQQ